MILNIIIILLGYYLFSFFKKLKENRNLHLEKKLFKYSLSFVVVFFILFVFFFRFLNLFRKKSTIDLYILQYKISQYSIVTIILIIVLFLIFIKLFSYIFKLNFLKLHYNLMNNKNFRYSLNYIKLIYFFATWPNRLILFFISKNILIFQFYRNFFYYFLRYFFSFIMIMLFITDIVINNYCLVYFTIFLNLSRK